jgi:hypothetical protein
VAEIKVEGGFDFRITKNQITAAITIMSSGIPIIGYSMVR